MTAMKMWKEGGRKKVKRKEGRREGQSRKGRKKYKQKVANLLEYSRISRRSRASNPRRKKSGMRVENGIM